MNKHNYTEYIVGRITDICKNYKRRIAGTPSARAAADDIAEEAKAYADEVRTQDFEIHPHAFLKSIQLCAAMEILARPVSWIACLTDHTLLYLVSNAMILLGYVILIAEYVLYNQIIDKFCPKFTGKNVYAVRKPKGEVKRRIILCGHHDAAFEMPLLKNFKMWMLYTLFIVTIGGGIIDFLLNYILVLDFLPFEIEKTFMFVQTGFMVLSIPMIFFTDFHTVVDGANDNLTGTFLSMSILKEMADNDFRYENTEVCVLITDGEESGLRGAAAFAKENISMLMNANTIVIALDTIHETEQLQIYDRGINFTEKNADEVCNLLSFAGLKNGVELPYAEFYPGAVDSEAFSRLGVKAAGLCAVRHEPAPYYHTVQDSYDNLNPECIELTRKIIKTAVDMFDDVGHIF